MPNVHGIDFKAPHMPQGVAGFPLVSGLAELIHHVII